MRLIREALVRRISVADRPEVEQAILRLAIVGLVYVYIVRAVTQDAVIDANDAKLLAVGAVFVFFSVAILIHTAFRPRASPTRRYLGMFADNAATTYCLIQMGEAGAFVLGVYLFVTFGNGFRFGKSYLRACQAMAIAGYSLVLWLSPFWSQHIMIGMGLLTALIILPLYVAVLTERIRDAKKKADEANHAKSRFLASMSHEMRTPLNGVIAMADVLRETRLNDSQREIVETMTTSAHLLLAQIEDVLDMAKIEAGRIVMEVRPFDLARLVTSSVKVMLPQARYKGLTINTDLAPAATQWFAGDSHHIRQVLLNLIANAVKFTERGRVDVKAMATPNPDGTARVRFEVQDTGIGIPSEKQATIFDPFVQADDSITRLYGGTGLGTTIAQQLITLMGGRIGVESNFGFGSLFWFELDMPLAEPRGIDLAGDATPMSHSAPVDYALGTASPASVHKIRGARILVAEDNLTNQKVAQLILESGGHSVTIVRNGEEALDALERGGFDLALLDLSMPVISGVEALKLYQFTSTRPVPVLILSANVTTEAILECERAGAAEFISKPLRASILLDAIERHLKPDEQAKSASPPPRSDERPSFTVVDTPPLQESVLSDLARLSPDPTFVERLIHGFKSDAQRLQREIVDALTNRKYEAVKDSAHALKGGAASVGAALLAQVASRLDKASHDALRLKAASWIEELNASSHATLLALDAHLEQRQRQLNGDTPRPASPYK